LVAISSFEAFLKQGAAQGKKGAQAQLTAGAGGVESSKLDRELVVPGVTVAV
jgi:hypothetical protein